MIIKCYQSYRQKPRVLLDQMEFMISVRYTSEHAELQTSL